MKILIVFLLFGFSVIHPMHKSLSNDDVKLLGYDLHDQNAFRLMLGKIVQIRTMSDPYRSFSYRTVVKELNQYLMFNSITYKAWAPFHNIFADAIEDLNITKNDVRELSLSTHSQEKDKESYCLVYLLCEEYLERN